MAVRAAPRHCSPPPGRSGAKIWRGWSARAATDVPPLKRARFSGNGLYLFHFSTLWEFLLGGYSGRGERQRGGDGDAGGADQSADVIARLRNLMIGRAPANADFGDAQAGEAVESFLYRHVAVAPAPSEPRAS